MKVINFNVTSLRAILEKNRNYFLENKDTIFILQEPKMKEPYYYTAIMSGKEILKYEKSLKNKKQSKKLKHYGYSLASGYFCVRELLGVRFISIYMPYANPKIEKRILEREEFENEINILLYNTTDNSKMPIIIGADYNPMDAKKSEYFGRASSFHEDFFNMLKELNLVDIYSYFDNKDSINKDFKKIDFKEFEKDFYVTKKTWFRSEKDKIDINSGKGSDLDYILVSEKIKENITDVIINYNVQKYDHQPIEIQLEI
ncbi:MAG: hypothetical protein Q4F88_06645 [Eubacteriales bacterium]|nr:hypothetical protein [Eubacteriales bacterium]